MQRRHFIQTGFLATVAACIGRDTSLSENGAESTLLAGLVPPTVPTVPLQKRICLFTDNLDDYGYSYEDVAKMIGSLKIAGPDLTVRPGGLVPPDRVVTELPKAAAAFRDQGLSIPMISTNLTSVDDPTARPILSTMNKLGIGYYKLGYYHYHDLAKWEAELAAQRKHLAGLTELSRSMKIQAGFHNHSGAGIGGALWDAWEFLSPLDPAAVGFYFDPAHASIEGAKHAWKLNLQRISPRLTMIALKDYVWEKTSGGGWQTRWCPLGTGMVDWKEFFRLLSQFPFPGPISIHIEYETGGSTRPERIDNSLAAAQRDIAFVLQHLGMA
ncbi:MAG: Xylose isomerase-like barrel [Planctomycetaceae bacterium]|nr:Xylose isomerase-like barrel [Planctomycetaceae bacterium]